MLGAFAALLGFRYLGINYWLALFLVPLVVGAFGVLLERFLLRRIAHLDHLYGLLLTFGLRPSWPPVAMSPATCWQATLG